MNIQYDPAENELFWKKISAIPGYPGEMRMPIQAMIFETGAVYRIPRVLEDLGATPTKRLLVVMDETPMKRGSDSLKPLILNLLTGAGYEPDVITLLPDHTGQVHTDMEQIGNVQRQIGPDCAVLAVGSGTVTDISKHACHLYGRETGQPVRFVVFQTANSVNAFTSNMAPTFINGVKRTLDSRYPDALICDLETLADAPVEMNQSGVGDLLSGFVSFADWKLAGIVGLDPTYSDFPRLLVGPLDQLLFEYAPEIKARSLKGMEVLAKLISLSGLTMSLMGVTTPSSGFEHVMSHVLDMIGETQGRPLFAHGTQVSLTTLISCEIYRALLDTYHPSQTGYRLKFPEEETMRAHIERTFKTIDPSGQAGEECWHDYQIKLRACLANQEKFDQAVRNWDETRAALSEQVKPTGLALTVLKAVDAPTWFEELVPPVPEADVKFAFLNAPLMRKRFTVGDFLILLDWDREALWGDICERLKPARD